MKIQEYGHHPMYQEISPDEMINGVPSWNALAVSSDGYESFGGEDKTLSYDGIEFQVETKSRSQSLVLGIKKIKGPSWCNLVCVHFDSDYCCSDHNCIGDPGERRSGTELDGEDWAPQVCLRLQITGRLSL